jgi:hypothetical protein
VFMKKMLLFGAVILAVFFSCENVTNETEQPVIPVTPELPEPPEPIDPAFWFGEIHSALIARVGSTSSDDYTGQTGEEMGQIANCQYVCNAINAKWQTTYVPVAGTELKAANCKYLLKMIDKANRNTTTYGTSEYATLQMIDTTAVNDAVNRLWKPAGKFVAVAYTATKPPTPPTASTGLRQHCPAMRTGVLLSTVANKAFCNAGAGGGGGGRILPPSPQPICCWGVREGIIAIFYQPLRRPLPDG